MTEEMIAGRYRLLEPLGRGAMSSVWLAEDTELARRVAVKMLAPSADRARFEREARAAASLSHPNISSLYDYGTADDRPFMVLEYLPNGTLEEQLKGDRPLDDAETQRIATEVASGLAHAHERGLVHRDLKPANILFDAEGRAKIADFGIARMGDAGTLTEAGTVLGTASYISPEQASGLPAGPASDVYSFGVMLFRMLTGVLPFAGQNAMEIVRMHRDEPPPAVHDLRPDAPPRLESIVTAALAKDPADRPPDGGALLRELRSSEGSATMIAAPGALAAAGGADATQVIRPAAGPRRRRPLLPLVALALVLLLAGIGAALIATGHTGGSAQTTNQLPGLSLPTVSTAGASSGKTTTTQPSSTTTTQATTTTPTTTHARTTTRAVTTIPVTPPTTVAPPPTTTSAPPPTTTFAPPPTTTDTTPVTTDTTGTTTTTP